MTTCRRAGTCSRFRVQSPATGILQGRGEKLFVCRCRTSPDRFGTRIRTAEKLAMTSTFCRQAQLGTLTSSLAISVALFSALACSGGSGDPVDTVTTDQDGQPDGSGGAV